MLYIKGFGAFTDRGLDWRRYERFSSKQRNCCLPDQTIKRPCSGIKRVFIDNDFTQDAPEVGSLLTEEFEGYARCELLVIANKKNFPSTIGGILGLSQLVVVSPESISMVSEAASSGKYIVVFKAANLGRRHNMFLNDLAVNRYIYISEPDEISKTAQRLINERPAVKPLQDTVLVTEALKRIL